jgi:A/G-specific adenine glycosylase
MDITQKLITWYQKNYRRLPWRNTRDPYKIWLSEVILQQTRINQGMDYYLKFVENYPTVNHLANADEDEVLKLWQGLGYYSRARNLHKAAKIIQKDFGGEFPRIFNQIKNLPGIGGYTASAISSIAFGEPFPAIDGNVLRVVSRLFAIEEPIDSNSGKKNVEKVLQLLIDKQNPGIFNQAVMEFGATWCKPQNPDCPNCIFTSECLAFTGKIVDNLPVKAKKPAQKVRYFYYLNIHLVDENNRLVYLRKRSESDIWKGLYDFPLIETSGEVTMDCLINDPRWLEIFFNTKPVMKKVSGIFTHILTHQKIIARFVETEIKTPLNNNAFVAVKPEMINNYPVPRLFEKYFQSEEQK